MFKIKLVGWLYLIACKSVLYGMTYGKGAALIVT